MTPTEKDAHVKMPPKKECTVRVKIMSVGKALLNSTEKEITGMTCDDEGCPHYGTPHGHKKKDEKEAYNKTIVEAAGETWYSPSRLRSTGRYIPGPNSDYINPVNLLTLIQSKEWQKRREEEGYKSCTGWYFDFQNYLLRGDGKTCMDFRAFDILANLITTEGALAEAVRDKLERDKSG